MTKAIVTLGFKSELPYFCYTLTQEDSSPLRQYSGEVDAFITKGKDNYKGKSKVYRNVDGVLQIQSYERGEDKKFKVCYSKAIVTFNVAKKPLDFLRSNTIHFDFGGNGYTLKPGEQITFGTEANPKVTIMKF